MNQEELKQQIKFYITHPETAYQDWWLELNPPTAGVRDVALGDDLEKRYQRFRNWFKQWYEDNQQALRQTCRETPIAGKTICEHWAEIKNSFKEQPVLWTNLVAMVFAVFSDNDLYLPVASVFIVVTDRYLDVICADVI